MLRGKTHTRKGKYRHIDRLNTGDMQAIGSNGVKEHHRRSGKIIFHPIGIDMEVFGSRNLG